MIYKFTESAKNVIEFANSITLKLGHSYIGTEHLLYGLTTEDKGVASKVLMGQGINSESVLTQIEKIMGSSTSKSKKLIRIYS